MGMVVRTNTMAVNAYRQLNMNQTKLAKSLEKLASGFRVNRAADDAAGLAISEKMKAQIVGLEAASMNALDGISMVQTAEGALTEVHNMLNRMVYLATRSANGTYQDEVDREAMQSEVNALLDEINRIGDSANFNSIKLLDGSLQKTQRGNVTLSKELDNRYVLDMGKVYVAATAAVYSFAGHGASGAGVTKPNIPGVAANSATAIYAHFGLSRDDYTVKEGTSSTDWANVEIRAKFVGVDPMRDQILSKADTYGNAFEKTRGMDAYEKVTIDIGDQARDTTLINKKMNVNGREYTFVGASDLLQHSAGTAYVSNGDKLADGSYAIVIEGKIGARSSSPYEDPYKVADAIAEAINKVELNVANANLWDANTGKLSLDTTKGYVAPADADELLRPADFLAKGATVGATFKAGDYGAVVIDPAKFNSTGDARKGGLTLQIGDTNDSFNKVNVSIDNMKAAGLGLTGLKIDTQENAGNAIQTIRNAINKVSTNRANLGAMQNRLEYTINNLDIMAENMMAANSRIRDTDMAKEMMEFTKLSILTQSATAMLAQANMQPQSVLQLLQ